jgi:hypothetical protein
MGTPLIEVDTTANPPTAEVKCQALINVTVKQNGMQGPYMDRVQIHYVRRGDTWLIESYKPEKDWRRRIGR